MYIEPCKECGLRFKRNGTKPPVFCSLFCKSAWQRKRKPVTKEWLENKYLVERLGCYEIARIVKRNPKNVYGWLKNLKIPLRNQKTAAAEAMRRPSKRLQTSNSSKGRKHTRKTRKKISVAKKGKHYPALQGRNNGMYGRRGVKHPNWRGGHTPKRAQIYSSIEWRRLIRIVEKRDSNCRLCGLTGKLQKHHIIAFSKDISRATDHNNVISLCVECHNKTRKDETKWEKRLFGILRKGG